MSTPDIQITFDDDGDQLDPGDTLVGQFLLSSVNPGEIRAVELSVLWYTEGKGDEDLAVHYFERIDVLNGLGIDLRGPRRFSTRLPNSPLSYAGVLLSVVWCVRVRVFPVRGEEFLSERRFRLGSIPAPEPPPHE